MVLASNLQSLDTAAGKQHICCQECVCGLCGLCMVASRNRKNSDRKQMFSPHVWQRGCWITAPWLSAKTMDFALSVAMECAYAWLWYSQYVFGQRYRCIPAVLLTTLLFGEMQSPVDHVFSATLLAVLDNVNGWITAFMLYFFYFGYQMSLREFQLQTGFAIRKINRYAIVWGT